MKFSKFFSKRKIQIPELKIGMIDKILQIEERIYDKDISEELIFEATEIYSKFVDFCETFKSPLRKYFREKISNLYLRKEVIKILIKNEKQANDAIEEIGILGNSFLKFSEIQEMNFIPTEKKNLNNLKKSSNSKDYENYKIKKNVNAMMMYKVKDEMLKKKKKGSSEKTIGTFEKFKSNDNIIEDELKSQFSLIQEKLNQRKKNSMMKDLKNKSFSILQQSNNNFKDVLLSALDKDKFELKFEKKNFEKKDKKVFNKKNILDEKEEKTDNTIEENNNEKVKKKKLTIIEKNKKEDFFNIIEEEEFDYDISQITSNN